MSPGAELVGTVADDVTGTVSVTAAAVTENNVQALCIITICTPLSSSSCAAVSVGLSIYLFVLFILSVILANKFSITETNKNAKYDYRKCYR